MILGVQVGRKEVARLNGSRGEYCNSDGTGTVGS
jgi:hypothetical protein